METGTSQQKITLAFISDKSPILDLIYNELLTSGIEVLFRSEDIEVALFQLSTLKTLPKVCIIDLDFYNKNVLTRLKDFRTKYPTIKLIAHNDNDDEKIGKTILNIGFSGYLLVGSATNEIKTAIDVICQGGTYFSSGISKIAQSHFNKMN